MINILTEQNVQASLASLKPTDVLILPELGDVLRRRLRPPAQDDSDRRGGGAEGGRSAVGAQPAAGGVRGAPSAPARRGRARPAAGRRDPVPGAHPREPSGARGRDGNPTRAADRSADARPRHAAHLRHRRLRARGLPRDGGDGQTGALGRRDREVVGPELPALRSRSLVGLLRGRILQPARELPQDLDQQPRRGVADGSPGGAYEPGVDRVLPAAPDAAVLLRRPLRRSRAPGASDLRQRPAARHLRPPVRARGPRRRQPVHALRGAAARGAVRRRSHGGRYRAVVARARAEQGEPGRVPRPALLRPARQRQLPPFRLRRDGSRSSIRRPASARPRTTPSGRSTARPRSRSATTRSTSGSSSAAGSAATRYRGTTSSTGAASCSSRVIAPARCSASRSRSGGSCTSTGWRASR